MYALYRFWSLPRDHWNPWPYKMNIFSLQTWFWQSRLFRVVNKNVPRRAMTRSDMFRGSKIFLAQTELKWIWRQCTLTHGNATVDPQTHISFLFIFFFLFFFLLFLWLQIFECLLPILRLAITGAKRKITAASRWRTNTDVTVLAASAQLTTFRAPPNWPKRIAMAKLATSGTCCK